MSQSLPFSDATIIFDLDGTLVDTAPDLMLSLDYILDKLGRPPVQLDDVRKMIGQGARVLIQEGLARTGPAVTDDKELDRLMDEFVEYYGKHIADGSRLFPGLDSLLEDYRSAGIGLGVCTNKLESLSRLLLEAIKVDHLFPTIIGRDTVGVGKPDPAPLLAAIERAGGKPERTVYIGDSITDVKTARAANVPIVLVSFGYTPVPAAELGGDVLIDHFDELNDAVAGLLR